MSEKPSWTKWMVEAAASTARARAITERSSSRRDDRSSRAGRPFETGRRVKKVPTEKSTTRYIARRYNSVRMAVTRREAGAASPVDYETLAELRYQIRLFMRRREGPEPVESNGQHELEAEERNDNAIHGSARDAPDADRRRLREAAGDVDGVGAGAGWRRQLQQWNRKRSRRWKREQDQQPEREQRRQPGRVVDGPPAARHLPDDHRAEGRPLRLRQVRHPAERYEDARRQRGVAEEQQHDAGAHRGPLRRARHQRVQPGARRAPGQGDDELSRQPGCGAEPGEHHLLR